VRCGLDGESCAVAHWCPPLKGEREKSEWRAPCPVCQAERALRFSLYGRGLRWWSYCADHDREALRPVLRQLLGDCLPGRSTGPAPVDHDDLIALGLSEMPPMSLRLAILEMGGLSTPAALDKLGVRREHRSRVIAGRTGGAPKRVQKPRS
jgi:hypothetical protein